MSSRFITVLLISGFASSKALECYDRNVKNGTVSVSDCGEDCRYCVFGRMEPTDEYKPTMFGMNSDEDSLELYNAIFDQSNELYEVLSLCVLEKYVTPPLIKSGRPVVEVMLRCMCNQDGCNLAVSLNEFFKQMAKSAKRAHLNRRPRHF